VTAKDAGRESDPGGDGRGQGETRLETLPQPGSRAVSVPPHGRHLVTGAAGVTIDEGVFRIQNLDHIAIHAEGIDRSIVGAHQRTVLGCLLRLQIPDRFKDFRLGFAAALSGVFFMSCFSTSLASPKSAWLTR